MKLSVQLYELQNLNETLLALKHQVETLEKNSSDTFIIFAGMLIFLMQCGFAFLEAGSVQRKNTVNILIKNTIDIFVGSIAFWAFGYAFAYGSPGNGFIGHNFFFSSNVDIYPSKKYPENGSVNPLRIKGSSYFANWFFQYVFAATATTIVSGAVAERVEFVCYVVYSFTCTGFIYPTVAHWVWSTEGWLYTGAGTGLTMQDFAGSSTVHVSGGVAALVGAKILGPRMNRFTKEGVPIPLAGHSVPLVSLGAFFLFVGFLSFNAGSHKQFSDESDTAEAALAIMNTILCGSFGGLVAMLSDRLYNHYKGKECYWSLLMTINGALTGMVASCAGCNDIEPWVAMVIGTIAGIVFTFGRLFVLSAGIDDPLDAVAVHLGGGLVGTTLTPILAIRGQYVDGERVGGIIYSGHSQAYKGLAWNLTGLFSIMLWSGITSFIIFYTLSLFGLHRVTEKIERLGMDVLKHGEQAYPMDYSEECNNKKSTKTRKGGARILAAQLSTSTTANDNEPHHALPQGRIIETVDSVVEISSNQIDSKNT